MENLTARFSVLDEMSAIIERIAQSGQDMADRIERAGAAADSAFGNMSARAAAVARTIDGVATSIDQTEEAQTDLTAAMERASQTMEELAENDNVSAEAKEELAQVRRELQTAEDDVNFYRDKVLDSDDLTDLAQLVDSYISGLRDKVKAAEAAILEYAEHPETTTFVDAVRGRKNLAKAIEYYQALAQRIKHAQGQ